MPTFGGPEAGFRHESSFSGEKFFRAVPDWEKPAHRLYCGMRILAGPARAELVVQRSRFLGLLFAIENPEEARWRLKLTKAEFADATHVVHAFRTGGQNSETQGCSDDGEPSGTAGRPVLDVLKGAGGGNAILLVVRWYGGINLGTGGLVKAYGETAKAVIAEATWEELRTWISASVQLDWNEHRPLKNRLTAVGAVVDEEVFATDVTILARVPADAFDSLQAWTIDLTRGRCCWKVNEPSA